MCFDFKLLSPAKIQVLYSKNCLVQQKSQRERSESGEKHAEIKHRVKLKTVQ